MSTQPPPRYVVQTVDAPNRRRRRWLYIVLAWLASLVAVGVGVYFLTDRGPLASPDHSTNRKLVATNARLQQQVTTLSSSLKVTQVAEQSLKVTLSDREEKIDGLRADLAFYSHLIGGGAQHHGLRVQDVHLAQVDHSRAWNVTITLTHNVRRGTKVTGNLEVAVEGILDGHLIRLPWTKLSGSAESKGLGFDFRYFQQVRGTLMLPDHFTPNRVRVTADPAQGQSVVRVIDWGDALKSVENNHVQ
ncbi:MAG TPA: DUF6776 family protein [Rhodanobacteraceae bacterium]